MTDSGTLLGVARAFDGEQIVEGDVAIQGGRVQCLGVPGASGDRLAAPGFVDLQVNGFGGIDLQTATPERVMEMGAALAASGVTAYQPTVITGSMAQMTAALAVLGSAPSGAGLPRVLPTHLEGPFLAPTRRGAHPSEFVLDPDPTTIDELLGAGRVGYVTVAPERPGALELVERLCAAGVVVSAGHSDATFEQAEAGFAAGITAVTHALNAMRPFGPRDPGPLAAALVREDIWVTAIADGVHLHPATLRLLQRAAGDRFVAISDAIVAAGLQDGEYRFGQFSVQVRGSRATLADGRLVGSVAGLDAGLRQLVRAGVGLEDGLAAITSRPAATIGAAELGHLRVGGPADIVILDRELYPLTTFVAGCQHRSACRDVVHDEAATVR